jgi:hypothetical protein
MRFASSLRLILKPAPTSATPATPAPALRCAIKRLGRPLNCLAAAVGRRLFGSAAFFNWFGRGNMLLPRWLVRICVRAIDDLLEVFLVFLLFEEIGDVKEGIAFESNVDECRLHSREDPRYAAFVDGTCQRVFVLTLEINFGKLFVFDHRDFGFVRSR